MNNKKLLPFVVLLVFFACGCGMTVNELMNVYDQDVAIGNFSRSLPAMQERIADDDDNSHEDTLLWRFLTANAMLLTGKNADAIKELDQAEDLFLVHDRSLEVNSATASMLVNETYQNFEANGQYRMFCAMYKALAYASGNNKNAARTEFNRMMEYQENWLFQCRKQIAAAEKKMNSELGKNKDSAKNNVQKNARDIFGKPHFGALLVKHCHFDSSKSGDLNRLSPADYQNAYFTHLYGVFRWLNGDNGVSYLRDAERLKPDNPVVAADRAAAADGHTPENDVWIYVEDGLCPIRSEARIDLPMILVPYANKYVHYAGMALPALEARAAASHNYHVTAGDVSANMIELENIDRLLRTEYDVYMREAVRREIARCLLKVAPQVALGIAADHASDDNVRLGLQLAQLSAASYAAASTKADLRCWRALPKRVLVYKLKRPEAGKITLSYANGQTIIDVPEGNSIIWFRKAGASAPPVINTINFSSK